MQIDYDVRRCCGAGPRPAAASQAASAAGSGARRRSRICPTNIPQFVTHYTGRLALPAFLAILSTMVATAGATTYYVSPAGNDNNSGSSAAPFQTLQKAANIVNPGDTVIVKNGTYTDTNGDGYVVSLDRGGTSSAWITFKSEHKWGAVLDGADTNRGGVVDGRNTHNSTYCWFNRTNYITIEGFEITGCLKAIFNNNRNHDLYVYQNNIHDIGRIETYGLDGKSAIHAGKGTYNFTFDSNVFHTIGRLNPHTTPPAPESSCTTPSNYIYNHGTYKNLITCYNHDHALYLYGSHHRIINNVFYDLESGWAIQVAPGAANIDIVNNTFADTNPKRNGQVLLWGDSTGGHSDVLIENNLFYQPTSGAVNNDSCTDYSNIAIKDNITTAGDIAVGGYSSCLSLSGNRTGTSPQFVGPARYDFHLQPTSPAIDQGSKAHAPAYDFDGNKRTGAPDLGAYEWQRQLHYPRPTPLRRQRRRP
jgi:Pel9A-like, right handed beta helix region